MLQYGLVGLAFLFILEGILPFLSPRLWRRLLQQMMIQSDKMLHIYGFVSMLIGLCLLYWVH